MKKLFSPIFALILFILIVLACVETEPVSPIPHISFKDFSLFTVYDSFQQTDLPLGVLEFEFIDGDADIGIYYDPLMDADPSVPNIYKNNVFLIAYEKDKGSYYEICPDTICPDTIYYKIFHDTKLDRVGQNKTIKGIIRIRIKYESKPEYDTIRYDFFIMDRARNFSNIESTSDITFNSGLFPDN